MKLKKISGHDWSILAIDHKAKTKSDFLLPEFDYLAFIKSRAFVSTPEAWSISHSLEDGFQDDAFQYIEPSFSALEGIDDQKNLGAIELMGAACSVDSIDNLDTEGLYEWSVDQLHVRDAWKYCQNCGKPSMGKGIKIAHPDSGFVAHQEFGSAENIIPVQDYVESDMNPAVDASKQDPLEVGGVHGLSTGSVIISQPEDDQSVAHVTGVAPEAELYVYRVTAPGDFLPSPVLVNSDMNKLASSIFDAVDKGCHVLSMSLGGLRHTVVHKAMRRAVENGMIILSAAGNKVMSVVFPASDINAITIGASNFKRKNWEFSSRGRKVDVCAPGQAVYRACYTKIDKDRAVHRATGTSFATAACAGMAALWLAHHGRDNLVEKYGKHNLNEVFRFCLKNCVADDDESRQLRESGEFGAGIVDALKLVQNPLPDYSELEGLGIVMSHTKWCRIQDELEQRTDSAVVAGLANTFVSTGDAWNISKGFFQSIGAHLGSYARKAGRFLKEVAFNFELDSFLPLSIFRSGDDYKAASQSESCRGPEEKNPAIADNINLVSQNLLNAPISDELRKALAHAASAKK